MQRTRPAAGALRRTGRTPTLKVGLAAALLLLVSLPAPAEDALVPGQRVRISAAGVDNGTVIGTLKSVDADTLAVAPADGQTTVLVPRSKLQTIEVSDGARSRGIGALIGAGLGAAVGALIGSQSKQGYVGSNTKAAGGALLGAGIGALIGVAIPPGERWHTVATPGLKVGFAPGPGRTLGLQFAASF